MSCNYNDPFRQHIDDILFRYAQKHLIKNHAEYTFRVFQLLKPYILKEAPLVDPTVVTLPIDPFDNLYRLTPVDQLARYQEERFKLDNDATQLLKQHVRIRTGTLKTDRIMNYDGCVPLEPPEPSYPAFTRHFRRQSLFVRNSPASTSPHTSCSAMLRDTGILPVTIEAVQETDVPYEPTLKIDLALTAEEKEKVLRVCERVTDMRRLQPNYKNSVLHAFLHEDEPLPETIAEEFVPLFPRNRQVGYGDARPSSNFQSVRDLANIFVDEGRVGSDDSDMSFSKATSQIVDGWHTLKVSSPLSVTTPTSSQEDNKIDQLFLRDSPPTEPPKDEIIEQIEIPRSRSIGGSYGKKAHILHGQTLSAFLSPVFQTEHKGPRAPIEYLMSSPALDSLVNQASTDESSMLVENGYGKVDDDNVGEGWNMDIAQLCPNEDPIDIIMKVKIDNDDFMEVPALPSPNKHASAPLKLPTKLVDLTREVDRQSDRRPLKATLKGLAALRLSLSTFTTDTPLPSHEEICGVTEAIPSSAVEGVDKLLRLALGDDSSGRDRLSILRENPELPLIEPENDSVPLIAISRKSRRVWRDDPHFALLTQDHKRSARDIRSSPDIDAPEIKRPRIETGAETEQGEFYEPSVLRFEELVDTRMFDEFSETESSIDLTIVGQEKATAGDLAGLINDDTFIKDVQPSAITASTTDHIELDHIELIQVDAPLGDLSLSVDLTVFEGSTLWENSNISHLNAFTRLRARALKEIAEDPIVLPPSSSPTTQASYSDEITAIANDQSTLLLPNDNYASPSSHQFMTSMEFVQRQTIVRELRKLDVDLAERTSLGGVEIIVDPYSAIIISSLFTLPAVGRLLADRIADNSWRFQSILVLLEGYPETLSFRPAKSKLDVPELSAYTPPILKAIRKLRRDVTIAEAYGKKNPGCGINYSFADDVSAGGRIIRYFGDLAEGQDQTGGILWQRRDWLDEEEHPDEEDLSKLDGMNRMSAAILLWKASAEEILDMLPEERVEIFGPLIGTNAVNLLNNDICKRFGTIDSFDP